MRLLSCPNPEKLLEYVSIPGEMSTLGRTGMRLHTLRCSDCQQKMLSLKSHWQSYFSPEPDVTSSLIKVYSRLQNDETLILKGWKLSETPRHYSLRDRLVGGGWLFRGGVSLAALSLFAVVVVQQNRGRSSVITAGSSGPNVPFARIRVEDKNRVKVQYIQPELLQSVEFETTSAMGRR